MGALAAVVELLGAIVKLIQAGEDEAAQTEALYEAQEAIKRELDRRKFGGGA